MAKEKICKYCEHSYDIDSEKKVRCVYHDKYPKPSDCCDDWKERSDELINRQMAKQAVADAESILLAFAMVGHLPAFEPNLILPERMERGEVYDVGETITVMNSEDYMDMMCKAMMWDAYGEEPKHGEWIEVSSFEDEMHSVTDMRCNLCGKYSQMVLPHQTMCTYPICPWCGAKMNMKASKKAGE